MSDNTDDDNTEKKGPPRQHKYKSQQTHEEFIHYGPTYEGCQGRFVIRNSERIGNYFADAVFGQEPMFGGWVDPVPESDDLHKKRVAKLRRSYENLGLTNFVEPTEKEMDKKKTIQAAMQASDGVNGTPDDQLIKTLATLGYSATGISDKSSHSKLKLFAVPKDIDDLVLTTLEYRHDTHRSWWYCERCLLINRKRMSNISQYRCIPICCSKVVVETDEETGQYRAGWVVIKLVPHDVGCADIQKKEAGAIFDIGRPQVLTIDKFRHDGMRLESAYNTILGKINNYVPGNGEAPGDTIPLECGMTFDLDDRRCINFPVLDGSNLLPDGVPASDFAVIHAKAALRAVLAVVNHANISRQFTNDLGAENRMVPQSHKKEATPHLVFELVRITHGGRSVGEKVNRPAEMTQTEYNGEGIRENAQLKGKWRPGEFLITTSVNGTAIYNYDDNEASNFFVAEKDRLAFIPANVPWGGVNRELVQLQDGAVDHWPTFHLKVYSTWHQVPDVPNVAENAIVIDNPKERKEREKAEKKAKRKAEMEAFWKDNDEDDEGGDGKKKAKRGKRSNKRRKTKWLGDLKAKNEL